MKQIVILSGKGGTGKTTVTAALAHLAAKELALVLVDADVDAANLELVLEPQLQAEHDFVSGEVAAIDPELCEGCGICADVCRFDAISQDETGQYVVDGVGCEGCASCFYQCPEEAIEMQPQQAGKWFQSETRFGSLYHAHLYAGQENSGKLVTMVKQQGRLQTLDTDGDLLLVDGPPGIGCPVISAVSGADVALLVTEPTVSGIHDLGRILETTQHFGVPSLAVINKADLNADCVEQIQQYCQEQDIPVVGQIPFDECVTHSIVQGLPVTAFCNGPVLESMHAIWKSLQRELKAMAEEQ